MNLNEDLVQLNHYKASCMKAQLTVEQCQKVFLSSKVEDARFTTRFGPQVIDQREKVLRELKKVHQSPSNNNTTKKEDFRNSEEVPK